MPVVDAVAADYQDDVQFLAVAGRSDMASTASRAAELITGNVPWGLDDSIWDLYGIPGQPATVLISQGVIVDQWFGAQGEDFLRERIENLIDIST